jgi:hypothetical protein
MCAYDRWKTGNYGEDSVGEECPGEEDVAFCETHHTGDGGAECAYCTFDVAAYLRGVKAYAQREDDADR